MANKNTSLATAFPPPATKKRTVGQAAASPTSAVAGVARRTSNAAKKLEASKLAMQKAGTSVLHTGETLGSLFLGSVAEGFLGQEKMKVGNVDLRAPIGLAAQGFGLFQMLSEENGGEHALALGNGVMGSWLASVGRDAGQALRERKDGGKKDSSQPQPPNTSFKGEPMVSFPPAGQPRGKCAAARSPSILRSLPARISAAHPRLWICARSSVCSWTGICPRPIRRPSTRRWRPRQCARWPPPRARSAALRRCSRSHDHPGDGGHGG